MSADADARLVDRDGAIPGLAIALDATSVATRYCEATARDVTGARMAYVRYKPGTSCLTSVELDGPDGPQTVVARAWATDPGGRAALQGACAHAQDAGVRYVVDVSLSLLLTPFPFDRAIPGLAAVHDPVRRARLYERLQLPTEANGTPPRRLVYKPARRYVAAVEVDGRPIAALKCSTVRDASRPGPVPTWLDGTEGVRAARVVAEHPRRAVRAMEWLPGALLADRLARGESCDADLRRVGAALARLHQGPRRPGSGESLERWRDRPVAGAPESLRALVRDLSWLVPGEHTRLATLVDALAAHAPDATGHASPIHGDFYAKQVLVDRDGVGLIDFDEATLGDPHVDLALFVAHLERDVCRDRLTMAQAAAARGALLDGYADQGGAWSLPQLELRLADALIRLAPHAFRHRDPRWPSLTRALIGRAESALARALAPGRASRHRGDGERHVPCDGAQALPPCTNGAPIDAAQPLRDDASLAFASELLELASAQEALGMRTLDDPAADGAGRRTQGGGGRHAVRAVRLVRHKAGRRAVLRFELDTSDGEVTTWFGKVRARGADLRTHRLANTLRAAGLDGRAGIDVAIPRPRGIVAPYRMALQERAPGIVATDLLLSHAPPRAIGAQMARAMLALHGAGVRAGRARTVDDELVTLRERLDAWRGAARELEPSIALLAQRCDAIAAPLGARPASALLHRDLHPDQLHIDGRTTWLLDLDLAADGDPALDAGNMVAHLLELGARHPARARTLGRVARDFVAAALARADDMLFSDAIARYTVLSLMRLCEIAWRYPDRRDSAPRLLAHLLHLSGRPLDLDALCRHAFTEPLPCA